MKRFAPVLVVIVIIVVVLLALAATRHPAAQNQATPAPSAARTANVSPAPSEATAVITYDGSNFSPSDTTVKSGDSITFRNTSSKDVQVDSDPHPAHTDDTDLNVGMIASGQSKTITVTKKGSFGIHNHLSPSQTGHITIQ